MDRLLELLAVILPSLAIGWLLAWGRYTKKLDKAQYDSRLAQLNLENEYKRMEVRARLSGVTDSELVRMVGDTGIVGQHPVIPKPNK
jgi:hypothetical protein